MRQAFARLHSAFPLALLVLTFAVAAPSAKAARAFDDGGAPREYRLFDRYLDRHPGVREQLYERPGLIENEEWREHQPGLNKFLRNHPAVREEVFENPRAFMGRERRLDRREDRWRDHNDYPDRY